MALVSSANWLALYALLHWLAIYAEYAAVPMPKHKFSNEIARAKFNSLGAPEAINANPSIESD